MKTIQYQVNIQVCLEYHIGNCKGPCEGLISAEKYNEGINDIINILKGNVSGVIRHLEERMKVLAESMNFEEAQELKVKLDSLKRYQSKSTSSFSYNYRR
jgi:excinuclease ABC subunit C